jgi:outer membrane protein OmpA-like peptidoglycan-associated protein
MRKFNLTAKENMQMKRTIVPVLITLLLASGCAEPMSRTQKGSLLGAGSGAVLGALAGQAIGRDTKGTLIGAAAGAAVGAGSGAAIGRYMDNQERAMREALASVQGVNVVREGNSLHVTFRSDSQFDVGSFTLRPEAQQDVARMAQILKEFDKTAIIVAGHTDSTGSDSLNQTLSENRAGAVKNIMLAQGVKSDRLSTLGFGKSQPIADNGTAGGRQLNRRVAITINPL